MELRHLRYFVAIAEALSFRRAAERLRLTRPALSKQMRELENELDVRLLDRNTARVSLTAAGAVFLREARDILGRVETAAGLAREAGRGRRGTLTIGEPGALSLSFFSAALATFREHFPHVDVVLKEIAPADQLAALAAGDIQVGFAFAPQVEASNRRFDSFTVLRLRLGAAFGRAHPLARRTSVRPADLAQEPLLYVSNGRRSDHAATLRRILAHGARRHKAMRGVATLGSLITMIASGHGVSILPHEFVHLRSNQIVIVPLDAPDDLLDAELKVVWRHGDDSALVKNFLRTLRDFPSRAGG